MNAATFMASRRRLVTDALAQRPDEVVEVSVGLWKRLAPELSSIMGEEGFRTLYARNLRLVAFRFPALSPTILKGEQVNIFDDLRASLLALEQFPATVASLALLESFLGTLSDLIGEALTYKILSQAWPDETLRALEKDTPP